MNRNELMESLNALSWVESVGASRLCANANDTGAKWYQITVFERCEADNTGIQRNVNFYVLNEGEQNESAYWKDGVLTPTLRGNTDQEPSYKMITFRTLLASTSLAPSIIAKIKAAATADTTGVLEEYVSMLSTYTIDGGIDVNNLSVQDTIRSMTPSILTQEEVDAVISLADN